jgi:hypothetical protein
MEIIGRKTYIFLALITALRDLQLTNHSALL